MSTVTVTFRDQRDADQAAFILQTVALSGWSPGDPAALKALLQKPGTGVASS